MAAALLCALAAAGCDDDAPGTAAPNDVLRGMTSSPDTPCPPEPLIEALHAAAFHFQHGTPADAGAKLAAARVLSRDVLNADAVRLMGHLERIRITGASDPAAAATETEWVRAFLSSWYCMPTAMHDSFHTRLPPIPGG